MMQLNRNLLETFTFLNDDITAVSAFVKETHHLVPPNTSSHIVKAQLYQHYFPDMALRPKFTGFEHVADEDAALRKVLLTENEGWMTTPPRNSRTTSKWAYLDIMSAKINRLSDKNLVFYSGGLDSEFVARLFMHFEKAFTPVVIKWYFDGKGCINDHDTEYALKFCEDHKLSPKIVPLNLSALWEKEKLKAVSQSIHDESPQRCAYKLASDIVGALNPDFSRIFAGEIRYKVK